MRALAALVVVAAVAATIAGGLFDAVHGGTTLASSIAYAFWFAAALCLALMAVGGTRLAWRRLDLPEGWVFVTASVLLTGAGAAIDALGS
jgi:hypothetical protein